MTLKGFAEFEFDLPKALLKELIRLLDGMETDVLGIDVVGTIPDVQGVYQLFHNQNLVYIGKTDAEAGLRSRLRRHALDRQVKAVNGGDLKQAEAMLLTQAYTLSELFNGLVRRAATQELLRPYEAYMRLALKAQSQCRTTLEALAFIKNPPNVAFVRQANIAHGPQQVNNAENFATCTRAHARVRETENPQSKLLEGSNGERLDFGTTCAASGNDPALGPLGTIHGSQNPRGETQSKSKRI